MMKPRKEKYISPKSVVHAHLWNISVRFDFERVQHFTVTKPVTC